MTELQDLIGRMVCMLDSAGIPFMVAGSFASAAHGLPRATQDIDVVIDPTPDSLDRLVEALVPELYYVDNEGAQDAMRRRSMFNVIDHASGWKIDFIIRRNREFSREEFARRTKFTLLGIEVFVASPEDTIVAKLEWSVQCNGSERQRRDVAGILASSGQTLDRDYIERWVLELGLKTEWSAAQTTVF